MSSTEGIPIRRMVVHDPKDMPSHYGETPGGSIFSTTPGGTRIYYDRAFLLSRRDSPMTRSPPHLPFIPEVTLIPMPSKTGNSVGTVANGTHPETTDALSAGHSNVSGVEPTAQATTHKKEGDDQFSMEM